MPAQYDLSEIDIDGPAMVSLAETGRLHQDMERGLEWMAPRRGVPPKLG